MRYVNQINTLLAVVGIVTVVYVLLQTFAAPATPPPDLAGLLQEASSAGDRPVRGGSLDSPAGRIPTDLPGQPRQRGGRPPAGAAGAPATPPPGGAAPAAGGALNTGGGAVPPSTLGPVTPNPPARSPQPPTSARPAGAGGAGSGQRSGSEPGLGRPPIAGSGGQLPGGVQRPPNRPPPSASSQQRPNPPPPRPPTGSSLDRRPPG